MLSFPKTFMLSHFNPRTREGCDPNGFGTVYKMQDFNPRTREGCDEKATWDDDLLGEISIHAPVKGATLRVGTGYIADFAKGFDTFRNIAVHFPAHRRRFQLIQGHLSVCRR